MGPVPRSCYNRVTSPVPDLTLQYQDEHTFVLIRWFIKASSIEILSIHINSLSLNLLPLCLVVGQPRYNLYLGRLN
jgi:hypothetical protein